MIGFILMMIFLYGVCVIPDGKSKGGSNMCNNYGGYFKGFGEDNTGNFYRGNCIGSEEGIINMAGTKELFSRIYPPYLKFNIILCKIVLSIIIFPLLSLVVVNLDIFYHCSKN